MKEIYSLSLLLFTVIMLIVGQKAKKKNSDLAKALIRLTYAVAITVISSMSAIILPNEKLALFMQTVHYASTEWMLIFLLAFLERYVENFEGRMPVRIITFTYSAFSTIQLLLNAVFVHVVYCEYVNVGDETYRMFINCKPWYNLHAYFCYILVIFILLALTGATVKTTAFYRRKYTPALIALLLTVACEAVCSLNITLMDYALYGYVSLGIFLTYFSVYHVNDKLINAMLSLITTDTQSGVVCFDVSNRCIYANDVMKELYQDSTSDIASFENLFSKYNYGRDKEESKWTEKYDIDGVEHYYEITFGKLEGKKRRGKSEYIGCYFYLYDRTKDVQSIKFAQYQAAHDKLTGLSTIQDFDEIYNEIRETYSGALYVIAADIKDFKLINDLFGHDKGDEILVAFAKAMKRSFPEYAACCRRNSDRFCFCVAKRDFSEETILKNLEKVQAIIKGQAFQLVAHFGIYEVNENDTDVSVMYDYARLSMASIKNDYDKYFVYFDTAMMAKFIREKELVAEFDKAIKEEQFLMYLQPQVKPDGTVTGAEALVRWKHPVHGMISPGEFIPTFERVGLIHKLDRYIWEKAAAKLSEWAKTDKKDFHISVNISTKDFYYIDLYKTMINIVTKYDIPPKKLKLEITESAFMTDPEKQLELIARLQEYGFDIEIDDFGSGYSSLNILKDMKADVLKIDMGFLRKTDKEERSKLILNNILVMAKDLNMSVISEGVEKKEQVEYLANKGCDFFQGFYFDRPIAVEEFEGKY